MGIRYTSSYKKLRTNVERAEVLLEAFFDKPGGVARGPGKPKAHEQELLRSVLVLAVSSLDAYLSDLAAELLPELARSGASNTVFDLIAKENPGLILRAMYSEDGHTTVAEALAGAIETQFQAKVMHGIRSVNQVSEWCDLDLKSSDYEDGGKRTLADLENWTKVRHRVVHRGEKVSMSRKEAAEVLTTVLRVGKVMNDRAIEVYQL